MLGRWTEISFGRRLFKLHGTPAVIMTENRILVHTFRRGTEELDVLAFEEVLAHDALDLGFILICAIILPILLCLLIHFDTLICDFDRQYEYVTHLFMRLLIRLIIRLVVLRLWQVPLYVQNLVGVDEVLSISSISVFT